MSGKSEIVLHGISRSSGITRYLIVSEDADQYNVRLSAAPPVADPKRIFTDVARVRYSPLFPAFVNPATPSAPEPPDVQALALLFSLEPHRALGVLKPLLTDLEVDGTHFSIGLASIVVLNIPLERASELAKACGAIALEHWAIGAGALSVGDVNTVVLGAPHFTESPDLSVTPCRHEELQVYLEQIYSSVDSLWKSYALYHPAELTTLHGILDLTHSLVEEFDSLSGPAGEPQTLEQERQLNAVTSAFVELSAALSYAVTQGTTGALNVLQHPSPFPHHSLLGVGGAVRAMTNFTRYLESAFQVRNAAEVVRREYRNRSVALPRNIARYRSGRQYGLPQHKDESEEAEGADRTEEFFDLGGDYHSKTHVPLITHFSLRHGFKEAKFSVTAASEALNAEHRPQWTFMTLSHEVMHSQVRGIFEALFGGKWRELDAEILPQEVIREFDDWYNGQGERARKSLDIQLRNTVLNYALALERLANPVEKRRSADDQNTDLDDVTAAYLRHKMSAVELFVHFHDYYFVYACQPLLYAKSLWASWIKVAPPYARPDEYLVRSLATLGCGAGDGQWSAFETAEEYLLEALAELEAYGLRSTLFDVLRSLLAQQREEVFLRFKPSHYLIEQVRLCFASSKIAEEIDRIEHDPFAEGSDTADTYHSAVGLFLAPNDDSISPIRYCLSSLLRSLSRSSTIDDSQWLTAWNLMVISSSREDPNEP